MRVIISFVCPNQEGGEKEKVRVRELEAVSTSLQEEVSKYFKNCFP